MFVILHQSNLLYVAAHKSSLGVHLSIIFNCFCFFKVLVPRQSSFNGSNSFSLTLLSSIILFIWIGFIDSNLVLAVCSYPKLGSIMISDGKSKGFHLKKYYLFTPVNCNDDIVLIYFHMCCFVWPLPNGDYF
ncbi:hypothetical protein CsSME_00004622 [Camellia sinensis var. sinensis]